MSPSSPTPTAASDLRECPFCGEGSKLTVGGDDKYVGVRCDVCGCQGPDHYASWPTWNDRAALAASPASKPDEAPIKEDRLRERRLSDVLLDLGTETEVTREDIEAAAKEHPEFANEIYGFAIEWHCNMPDEAPDVVALIERLHTARDRAEHDELAARGHSFTNHAEDCAERARLFQNAEATIASQAATIAELRAAVGRAKEDERDRLWLDADWRRAREELEKHGAMHPADRARARAETEAR